MTVTDVAEGGGGGMGAATSDDFFSGVLNTSLWTFVNPLADSTAMVTAGGTANASLEISLPAATNHDAGTVNTTPRLMQPAEDKDFELEVKFDSPLTQGFQGQGIIVQQDSDNYLRFDLGHNGSGLFAFAGSIRNPSAFQTKFDTPISVATPMFLRVKREGNQWTMSYGDDGTNWTVAGSFVEELTVTQVGVFASNYGSGGPAPAHTALVDYFFETSSPIVPEDGSVSGGNNSPVISSNGGGATASVNAAENQTAVTNVNSSDDGDAEGAGLTYSLTTVAGGGADNGLFTLNTATGLLTFSSAPDFETPADANTDNDYELQVTVTDSGGLTDRQDITVTVTDVGEGEGGGMSAAKSDDFFSGVLNTSLWTFINPLADSTAMVTAGGTANASLEISLPAATNHDAGTVNTTPRLMQPAEDKDFELEVKFDSPLTQGFQGQGIIVQQDSDNYLRFDLGHNGSGLFAFAGSIRNPSAFQTKFDTPISVATPMFLRVTREGNQWTMSYGDDGTNWTVAGSFVEELAVTQVGVFASNYGSGGPAPAHTALVDYFFETSSPIVPEDGIKPEGEGINTAPSIGKPIVDVTVAQDAPDSMLDLSSTFEDLDPGDQLTLAVSGNTNLGLVSTSLVGSVLTLSYAAATSGSADITIRATDQAGSFVEDTFQLSVQPVGSPVIDVWYGNNQQFGQLGTPQNWVNILGNVSDADGVASLEYTLNGGPSVSLVMGPDTRRLESPGDFNVDIHIDDLLVGLNTIVITATDTQSNASMETVSLDYSNGNVWPIPYSVDWSTVTEIGDVAQVVDGLWELTGDTVTTPATPGYDRLLAIGDLVWDDFEISVPVTIQGAVPLRSNPCTCNAIGFLLRWQGHSESESSPAIGYFPLGALALYRWDGSGTTERLWMAGNNYQEIVSDNSSKTLDDGVTYIFKARAETTPNVGGSLYSLKVWPEGAPEPPNWDLTMQTGAEDLPAGSILLLSHYVNATFGDVTITPLSAAASSSLAVSNSLARPAPADLSKISRHQTN